MIQESVVDRCVNRLSSHFGSRLYVRPPATAAELAELERAVGYLPRDLVIFFVTCNGLRIAADGVEAELHLWRIAEILGLIRECNGAPIVSGFVPIRGDRCGSRDCLVVAAGPAQGAVIRRDPWVPGAEVLSSSFGAYLDAWTNYLVGTYDADGHNYPDDIVAPFDAIVTGRNDDKVKPIRYSEEVQTWLRGLDSAVISGADFE